MPPEAGGLRASRGSTYVERGGGRMVSFLYRKVWGRGEWVILSRNYASFATEKCPQGPDTLVSTQNSADRGWGPPSSHDAMDCGGDTGACRWGLKQLSAWAHAIYSASCRNYRSPLQVLPHPNWVTFWQASRADDKFLHPVRSSALSLKRATPIRLQSCEIFSILVWLGQRSFEKNNYVYLFFGW